MKDLLIPGAVALATITLLGAVGCNQQQPQEKVVERVVVHDRPVIVRQEGDHHDADQQRDLDHRDGARADRPDTPAPDRPADHPDNRQSPPLNNRH
ncbi:MAG TPA: hypothetical protein VKQ54_03500 [Caulobacteraceae bacterium]|nr:hypothetical protein [Caulobacteraceae bacterium]